MKHRLEYVLVRSIAACVRVLPVSLVRACGGVLGRLAYRVDGFHRRVALENLAQAFPTRPPQEL